MSFARKFGDKYHKNLIDTTTKTGIDAVKTASKRVVQKTAGSTDLTGNKIADKTTSVGNKKVKKKKTKQKFTYHQKKAANYSAFEIRFGSWQMPRLLPRHISVS